MNVRMMLYPYPVGEWLWSSSLTVGSPVQDLTGDLVTYESIVSNYDMSASGAKSRTMKIIVM